MPHMLCYKLIPMTGGVIGHGLQETTNRLLIEWCDASILRHEQIFHFGKRVIGQCCANPIHDIADIKAKLTRSHAQVRRRWVACARFIVALSTFRYTKFFGELILSKPRLGA